MGVNTGIPDVLLSRTELLRGLGMQDLPASTVVLEFILYQCLAVVILSVEEALLDHPGLGEGF